MHCQAISYEARVEGSERTVQSRKSRNLNFCINSFEGRILLSVER